MDKRLKKPPRPFAMRQWVSSEPYQKEVEKIKAEVNKGSVNKFNLEIRLKTALDILDERDHLQNYALALESYIRRLRRQHSAGVSAE